LFVCEVMRTRVIAFEDGAAIGEARSQVKNGRPSRRQHLYPIIDAEQRLTGVVTSRDLASHSGKRIQVSDVARTNPVVAVADEPLRAAIARMAETGYTQMPVVDSYEERRIVGMISIEDMLHAHVRTLTEEHSRERVLRIRMPFLNRDSAAAAK
jgi:CBS-domain-containing membrane protein